jgi:hypothetical protein
MWDMDVRTSRISAMGYAKGHAKIFALEPDDPLVSPAMRQSMHLFARVALALALVVAVPACETYQDELARGQRAFEENEHERALAIFRRLEPDLSHLSVPERAQFAYLRGMTDFRIGYKLHARHWLAIAKALDDQAPGLLPADWKTRMSETLTQLNEEVYGGGIESLANAKAGPVEKEKKPAKSEDEP